VDEIAAAWWTWTAPLAVQAAAFALLVLVLDRLLERRGWPQLRLALWLLAGLRFALPPTLTSPVSLAALLPADEGLATGAAPGASRLFAAWLAGVLVAAALAVRQAIRVQRMTAGAAASPAVFKRARRAARRLGLRRTPRVVVSETAATAFVGGLLRPVVVLPRDAEERDIEPMLAHELAHVKRGDLVVGALLDALCVVFWFHPAAWLVRSRVARVREICCDATAAASLGPRAGAYRDALLRAALRLPGAGVPATAYTGATSQIVARLRHLERGPARRPRVRLALTLLAVVLLGGTALPMARSVAPFASEKRLIASGLDGSARPGCLRMQLAAMRIVAETR
jgi:beta-lactamase regulating signal transducer with metallopeptidase domain